MKSDKPDARLACSRSFKYLSKDGAANITVLIWCPVPDESHPNDLFRCDFDIVGFPDAINGSAAGVDSMQALACALMGVHNQLRRFEGSITFLDAPYGEAGQIVIGEIDPGRRRRILNILDEEQYSVERLVLRRKETQEEVRRLREQRKRLPQQDS